MKKILFLFLIAVTAACSSDSDSDRNANSENIVARWRIISQTVNNQPIEITDCQLSHPFITFAQNGISTETEGYQEGGTCFAYDYSYNYSINGNVLKEVEISESRIPFERKAYITNLTDTDLQLKVFYVRQENPNGSDDEENFTEAEQVVTNYVKVQ